METSLKYLILFFLKCYLDTFTLTKKLLHLFNVTFNVMFSKTLGSKSYFYFAQLEKQTD